MTSGSSALRDSYRRCRGDLPRRRLRGTWSDGGGSSLERRTPMPTRSRPPTGPTRMNPAKSVWTEVSLTGRLDNETAISTQPASSHPPGEAGEALVDDVGVFRAGSQVNLVSNPGFGSGSGATASSWTFQAIMPCPSCNRQTPPPATAASTSKLRRAETLDSTGSGLRSRRGTVRRFLRDLRAKGPLGSRMAGGAVPHSGQLARDAGLYLGSREPRKSRPPQ